MSAPDDSRPVTQNVVVHTYPPPEKLFWRAVVTGLGFTLGVVSAIGALRLIQQCGRALFG